MRKSDITKNCLTYLILLLIWLHLPFQLIAQKKPVYFNRLSTSNGLSQNRIFDIVQDHDGFIWIGTEDGLNKYDGYNFEIFKRIPGDSLSLNDNQAQAMYVAKDGTLWIGGSLAGLSKYNSDTKSFTRYNHDHSNPNSISGVDVNSFSEDEKGNLWVATQDNGFDYMIVNEGKFIHMLNMLPSGYPLTNDEINFLYQDSHNHLWIGSESRVHYFKISYNNTRIPQLQPVQITNQLINAPALSVEEDRENNIWIGTSGKGIFKFDRDKMTLNKFQTANENSALESLSILAIESDDKNNLWIGGVPADLRSFSDNKISGLVKLNINTKELEKFYHDPNDEKSLSQSRVLSIYIDNTGVIWIGTGLAGVNIYDKSVSKFSVYKSSSNNPDQLQAASRGFFLEDENKLWVASQGDGLVLYNRETGRHEFFRHDVSNPNSISANFVTCIHDDGNYLWIGTGSGLNRFDKKTKLFKRFFIDSTDIYSQNNFINYNILEIDREPGYLWFGTNGAGLVKFNKNDYSIKTYTYDPEIEYSLNNRNNFVRTVWYSKSRPDELWSGTTNGINILNLKNETFRYYNYDQSDSTSLSHPNVMHFYEDKNGYVWVATYGGGINRFDPKTERFMRFTEENSDLPNNGTYGILPDENGNLWISTNNGITKLDPVSLKFRNYTVDDGLQSEEFNGGSFHKAFNGELFFGGINGFNSFFPDEVSNNQFIPKIVLTDLKLFNQSISVGEDSPLKQLISKTKEITLQHWQNDVSFEYVALHFSNPSKNNYAFKLENYEDEWRYVNNTRIATYTNLDPGDYVFRVKGSNNDGLWNEAGISINIKILPPWWQTIWAYIAYGLILAGMVFTVDRFQRRRLLAKEKISAQIREAELRAQIAETENRRKSKELEEARQLQLSMLPKDLPKLPHLDIAVFMKTATEVGGDYYDFHVHLDGTLTVILGDATGHGMMSGMMVSIMKSLFMSDRTNKALKPFFENASDSIKDMQLGRLMMALTCVQIQNNRLYTTNAGMPPMFIYREAPKTIEEISINNMPLGAMRGMDYDVEELAVEKGDTMLLMSDGFAELQNEHEELYGYQRARTSFEKVARKEPEDIVYHLNEEGRRWTNGRELKDDVTFVVIKIK